MIDVKSYIKNDKVITSLDNIENEYFEYFNSFDDIGCLKYIKDFDYLEGAIIIRYGGNNIIGFKYWDLIDQLWSYFLNAIEELVEGVDSVAFYFPDQPIEMKLKLISPERILLSILNEKINLPKNELLLSLLKGAKHFFEILKKCSDDYLIEQSNIEINRIEKISSILNL